MPDCRKVQNLLLHTIFEPKEYSGSGVPGQNFYHKFLITQEGDGVSFDETCIGHGRLIMKKSMKLLKKRQEKQRDRYKGFAYISLEPQGFLLHPFISVEVQSRLGNRLFRIVPDERDKTHALVCLAQGICAKKEKNVCVGFTYNSTELCGNEEITRIMLELYQYFYNRMLTVANCEESGLITDCLKTDAGLDCTSNCVG